MVHDGLVCLLGDHRGGLSGLGVDVVVQIRDDGRELLLGLLVEVRHGDTCGEHGVVGVGGGHVCGSLGSLWRWKVSTEKRF